MDLLDPKLDVVFKRLLTDEPELLRDMLHGVLGRPVLEAVPISPYIPGGLGRKDVVLDIRALLGDGSRADVEMQMLALPALDDRLVFYGARDYSDQLERGQLYGSLRPTTVIAWLAEPLFLDLHRLHSVFQLRERDTHRLYGDQLSLHVLQLPMLRPTRAPHEDARVHRWARFLATREESELDRLASEDRIMSLAKKKLEDLSRDPTTRRLAKERADAFWLYHMHLGASERKGRAEGEAKGLTRGRADALLKLLGLRFGPVSEATQARIDSATLEQLDVWTERVLTATTADEVLAP